MDDIVIGGTYRHFKGATIEVTGVALHSETMEEMVLYLHHDSVKGKEADVLWVRSKKMFLEEVDKPEHNYKGPRFVLVEKK